MTTQLMVYVPHLFVIDVKSSEAIIGYPLNIEGATEITMN